MKRRREKACTSFLCATKYPVVLIHGVGFRDKTLLDYWGRIPKALAAEGAKVFYSHQDAWGTMEHNAEMVKRAVQTVLAETGAKKVNLLAHSKGGLEARYMISALGMEKHVASLTTICTPHHGSKTMDAILRRFPGPYRVLGWFVDGFFRLLGDEAPAFAVTSRQFTTAFARSFNATLHDGRVYVQSYASSLRRPVTDIMFGLTHFVVKRFDGPNDGLVSVQSAKWGRYRGEVNSGGRRGLSHGDVVDARRFDVKGMNIRRFYFNVVRELKEMGF